MPLTRRTAPLLVTAALLLLPVTADAANSTLSPTPPPGLRQAHKPRAPHPRKKPPHRNRAARPAKPRTQPLPQTGTDLTLEAAVAALLIAGGALLRVPLYSRHR